jgi:hypothetical protein
MVIRHPISRNLHYQVPDDAPWPELGKALGRYQELQDATEAAYLKNENCQAEIHKAAAEDAADRATAVFEGRKPSGTNKETAARQKAQEAEHDLEANRAAVALAFDQIVRVVEEHRAEWLAADAEAEREAVREHAAAIAALDASMAAVTTIRNRRLFLQKFPHNSVKMLPPRNLAIDGRSIAFERVRQALEQDATAAPSTHVPAAA